MEQTTFSHNGEFTIESPKGGHRTFKIKTAKHGALKGKRIISMLVGQDNTTDYKSFGEISNDNQNVIVWYRFRNNGGNWEKYANLLKDMILNKESSHWHTQGYKLHESTVCRICNRKLTTPESIKSGIGPECSKRITTAQNVADSFTETNNNRKFGGKRLPKI